jgi:hypothetical protein
MKKITLFIGVLMSSVLINAQNNYIPGLSPLSGPISFGIQNAPSGFVLQLHGNDQYCVSGEPVGPGGGSEDLICYGLTSTFLLTNELTGMNSTDGMLFRMSELDFTMQNLEGKLMDFKTGTSAFRLDGIAGNAWFGNTQSGYAGSNVGAVNIQGSGNGMYIRTIGNTNVGLTLKSGGNENIALQVFGTSSTTRNFVVQSNGFVFARKYTTTLANIPDYVFKPDYKLMPLSDLRNYITTNQHLPNIPSAAEYEETGVDLGELNRLLLEKVEELTLYTLQLEERLRKLENKK